MLISRGLAVFAAAAVVVNTLPVTASAMPPSGVTGTILWQQTANGKDFWPPEVVGRTRHRPISGMF